jgi:hypothetical protein
MLKKLFKPRFSERELLIIRECCSQCVDSMEAHERKKSLDKEVKAIMADIKKIMTKINE